MRSGIKARSAGLVMCLVLLAGSVTLFGQQAGSGTDTSATPPAKAEPKDSGEKDAGQKAAPSTATDNPFPEAQSAAAAKEEKEATQPAPSSATDKGKDGLKLQPIPGVSSSDQNLTGDDLGEATITRRHGKEDEFTRDLNPAGRLQDDLDVANLYMKDWNYAGAYLRYKDALQLDEYNETAIFGLGKSACMQKKKDEAVAELKDYLNLYPKGKGAKEAKKLLSDPKVCAETR